MKKLFFVLFIAMSLIACNPSVSDDSSIKLIGGTAISQIFNADDLQKVDAIKFSTTKDWRAVVLSTADEWKVSVVSTATKADVDWLTLNETSGGIGEFKLTLNMTENKAGASRKAVIRIVCGDSVILVDIEQKGVTGPVDPTPDPSMRYVKKVISQNSVFHQTLDFEYDNKNRINSVAIKGVNNGEDKDFIGLVTFAYDGNKVRGTISISDSEIITPTGDTFEITLNDKGVATQSISTATYQTESGGGEASGVNKVRGAIMNYVPLMTEVNVVKIRDVKDFTYDAAGYLTQVTSRKLIEEDGNTEPDTPRNYFLTWSNGNMTKILWQRESGFSNYDALTYSNIANNQLCNVNLIAIFSQTEWMSVIADMSGMFNYLGAQSKFMPSSAKTYNSEESFFGYEYVYTLDNQGYIVGCQAIRNGSSGIEDSVFTVEYVK